MGGPETLFRLRGRGPWWGAGGELTRCRGAPRVPRTSRAAAPVAPLFTAVGNGNRLEFCK